MYEGVFGCVGELELCDIALVSLWAIRRSCGSATLSQKEFKLGQHENFYSKAVVS